MHWVSVNIILNQEVIPYISKRNNILKQQPAMKKTLLVFIRSKLNIVETSNIYSRTLLHTIRLKHSVKKPLSW